MDDCNSISWEDGLSTIDAILDPKGNAFEALTEPQRRSLKDLRKSLIEASSGKSSLFSIIPQGLMGKVDPELSSKHLGSNNQSEADNGLADLDEDVSNYLLGFAGVKTSKKRTMKDIVKKTMFANKFISKLTKQPVSKIRTNENQYFNGKYKLHEWKMIKEEDRVKVKDMLKWENLMRWDFNVIELSRLTNNKPLFFIGFALLASPRSQKLMSAWCGEHVEHVASLSLDNVETNGDDSGSDDEMAKEPTDGYYFQQDLGFSDEILCNFLRVTEADYNPVPYHNSMHAADVTQTVHCLLQMGGKNYAKAASKKTVYFGMVIAALVHDIHHPGTNNDYQKNAQTELSIHFNDSSVLESMHLSRTFRRWIGKNRRPEMDMLGGLDPDQFAQVRKLMIHAILHTDMSKHFGDVNHVKSIIKLHNLGVGKIEPGELKGDEIQDLFAFMLHVADISNQAKPVVFENWTDWVLEEFFKQGDTEKLKKLNISPLCDRTSIKRAQSQIPFIKFIVQPTYETIAKVIPEVEKQVLPVLRQNLKFWEAQGKLESEKKKRESMMITNNKGL